MSVDPSKKSTDYQAQEQFWDLVEAILGGEEAIKNKARPTRQGARGTYLPKFAGEKDSVYDYRLEAAPFTNIYADLSSNLASKPFAKELAMKEGTGDQYLKLAENIDGQGNNLHVFAASTFKSALDNAIDWILVDFNKAKLPPGRKALSIAEVREQKLRPYWVHVSAKQMLAVYSDFVDGVEVIHHARIKECGVEINEFDEVSVQRVRVLNRVRLVNDEGKTVGYGPATWELWEARDAGNGAIGWASVDSGDYSIGVIPLVPVVLTERKGGSWLVEPALRDLVNMQMTEYRQEANLEWIKIMTCFPMLCVSGMATQTADGQTIEVSVGPNQVYLIPQNAAGTGPAGTVSIVEPSATSIAENRTQLELTRKEMRDLGMQPMTEANLTVVTTANVSKKASSAVQAWAFRFKDALEQAWKLTAMWLGDQAYEPEVVIHTDFAIEVESGRELDALLKAEQQGIYSKKTVREQFRRRDIVVNDLKDEDEEQRLAEQQEGLEPETPIDPTTGLPIVLEPQLGAGVVN